MLRRWPNQQNDTRRVEENLQSILTHMNAVEQNNEHYNNFFKESKNLDDIRKQDWKTILPEVYNMIKESNATQMRERNVKLATTNKKK